MNCRNAIFNILANTYKEKLSESFKEEEQASVTSKNPLDKLNCKLYLIRYLNN